ncbi:Vacuolar protein sorting-associated protein 11 [Rhizina undulata]
MLARSSISRGSSQLLRCSTKSAPSRGMAAAAASNSFHYSVSDAAGIKVAARDDGAPTTSLAVVVRGGSRYESAPGLAQGLARFAFKNTTRRSALRVQREVELLGGIIGPTHSRENIVLRAKFLRDDLPYFVEALGDVLSKTKYASHEFQEQVGPSMGHEIDANRVDPTAVALEAVHSLAFHRGLGNNLLAPSTKYLSSAAISKYASEVYTKGNIAVVASGTPQASLEKWTGEFFGDVAPGTGPAIIPTRYFGGETRIASTAGNAFVIAFPGSAADPKYKAEYSVIAQLLGGESAIKWNVGTSSLSKAVTDLIGVHTVAKHVGYTDAGLLYITATGPSPLLAKAGEVIVKAVKGLVNVTAEDVKRGIAQAKYQALAAAEDRSVGLEAVGQSMIVNGNALQVGEQVTALEGITVDAVKNALKNMLGTKASYAAVGDLHILPFAEEIGLTV